MNEHILFLKNNERLICFLRDTAIFDWKHFTYNIPKKNTAEHRGEQD